MSKEEEPPPLTPDEANADIYFVSLMDVDAVRTAEGLVQQVTLNQEKLGDMTNGSAAFIQELTQWMEQNEINGGVLNIHQFRAMINASSMNYRTYIRTEIGGLDAASKNFFKAQIQTLPRRERTPSITTRVASFARENIDGNRTLRIMGRFVLPIKVFFTGPNGSSLEVNFPAGKFVNQGMIQPKIPVGTQTGPVRVNSNGIGLTPFVLTINEQPVAPEPAVTGPVIRTGDVVNGQRVPPPRSSGPGPRSSEANVDSSDDEELQQALLLSQIPSGNLDEEDEELQQALLLSQEPVGDRVTPRRAEPLTLDQIIGRVFDNIDLDGSGEIDIPEIFQFIDILPLEQLNYGSTARRRMGDLSQQISNLPESSGQRRDLEQEYETLISQPQLSANDEVRQQVVEYIDNNGDLSVEQFNQMIRAIANNLYSEEDRNQFLLFLMNYIGYMPPPPPPVVEPLPSEIVFQAMAGGQETITVGQIRDFLTQARVPNVANIMSVYGRNSEENILSQSDFTNSFFDFTQTVQDTLFNYARTRAPASRVTPIETKEEKADREMAAIQRNLEEQARRNRQTANTSFNSAIPGLRRKRGKTYKQLYDDTWTEMDPGSNSRMTGVHFAKQRNLRETLEVLQDYYDENSQNLGTRRYDAETIKRDLLSWLSSDSEFSTETRNENGRVVGPITQGSRQRMVNRVMDCVHDQRLQNGTTDDNIHVDSTQLLNLIYTFVKGQSNPKFRSGFAAAWVKGVIEAYLERNDRTGEIVDGVTVFTYEDEPDPHVSCAPGTTHRILPAFNETLSRVFGENPPEMTEAEKQAALRPERSRKINRWLQLSINEPNATRQSSINFINGKIREERSNPAEWRAIVGDNELTIPDFVEQLYSTLEGGKRRNKRQTKRVKAKQTKAKQTKAKETKAKRRTPLKKRTRKI